MAMDTPVNTDTSDLYCTTDDVALIRREAPFSDHEARGRPTLTQVQTLIRWSMATIDKRTGQSWRLRKRTAEYHDFESIPDLYAFVRISLGAGVRQVRDLSAADGDSLEVRAGSQWENYLITRTQGVNGDYWIQGEDGFLYIKRRYWGVREDAVRITFRYGATSVPEDIQEACALLTAARLEETTIRGAPEAGGAFAVENRARAWKRDADAIISNYIVVGGLS